MSIRRAAALVIVLLTAGLAPLAAPAAGTAAAVPTHAAPARIVVDTLFEKRVVTLTNRKRAAHGCRSVRVSTDLRKAARKHSSLMARKRTLSHQLRGEPALGRRYALAGYTGWRTAAENIAVGHLTPASVVRAWMRSPGHRRNILDCRLREIGVGVVLHGLRLWWTQDFGRR